MSFTKIVQPIETRWNTYTACIESIVKLKPALSALKAEANAELADKIPDKKQFKNLEEVLLPMKFIQEISEKLQTDTKPSIHLVIFFLYRLANLAKGDVFKNANKYTKAFVESFVANLGKRVLNYGRRVQMYCLGNFIHPAFKGSLLKKTGGEDSFDKVIDYIKDTYKPEEPPKSQTQSQGSQDLFAPSDPKPKSPTWGAFDEAELWGEHARPAEDVKPPIDLELERWMGTELIKDLDLDILQYWKQKSKELPLLGDLARNILAVQPTSCSSERLFSEAGLVATRRRPLLATSSCERLVFIHENYDRVASMITRWKTDIKEFTYEGRGNVMPSDKDTGTSDTSASGVSGVQPVDDDDAAQQGTSRQALMDRSDPPPAPRAKRIRLQEKDSSSDPDDPASMAENLVDQDKDMGPGSPSPKDADDFYDPALAMPPPTPTPAMEEEKDQESDDDAEEVEEEEDE